LSVGYFKEKEEIIDDSKLKRLDSINILNKWNKHHWISIKKNENLEDVFVKLIRKSFIFAELYNTYLSLVINNIT
jgi:hypothetical protein